MEALEVKFQNSDKLLQIYPRQLELDKLAFLHNALKDQGEDLPSLDEIASDISGKKFLRPKGDFDLYESVLLLGSMDGFLVFRLGLLNELKSFLNKHTSFKDLHKLIGNMQIIRSLFLHSMKKNTLHKLLVIFFLRCRKLMILKAKF